MGRPAGLGITVTDMRHHQLTLLLTAALALSACSDSPGTTSTTPTTGTPTKIDITHACAFLSPADFAGAGFTVASDGEDVSENFNLATTSSVACQWMSDVDNISSSWELVIGTGDAATAFATDLGFAGLDTVTRPELGDEAYLVDKVSSFDAADHDFEVGVRIGDVYFTLSTTDDRGADALTALATLVAERLTP